MRHDFDFGLQSKSHVESIWAELKLAIKSVYKSIPNKNFLYFLRESEWKAKTKNLIFEEKLDFLSNEDLNNSDISINLEDY